MSMSKYELIEEATLHVKDAEDEPMFADGPDGEPDKSKPMLIHMYGPGTKQQAKAQQARSNRATGRIQRTGKLDMTEQQALADSAEFAAGCTREMENMEGLATKAGLDADDMVRDIYSNRRLHHVLAQAEQFARNTANFKQPSSKT